MKTIAGGVILEPDEAIQMVAALSDDEAKELLEYGRQFERDPREYALRTTAWLLAHNNRRPD